MSSIINRFTDPVFAITIVASIVLGFILSLPSLLDSYFVGFIVSFPLVGAIYVFYLDFVEKKKSDQVESAKEADLKRRIKAQAEAEAKTGKCISCLTELPADAENCPSCGFAVKHYSEDA